MSTRPSWCGPGEDPADAATRILAIAVQHDTHGGAARALGVSMRTLLRWWPAILAAAPSDAPRPARLAGGTRERAELGRARKRARRGAATNAGTVTPAS